MKAIKKLLVVAALALVPFYASAVVIQGDPSATGSSAYPNVAVDSSGRLVLSSSSQALAIKPFVTGMSDCSGSITTGGVSQQLLGVNNSRSMFLIQNISAGNLYINFVSAATTGTGSILLIPNQILQLDSGAVPNSIITVIGATTAQAFTCKYM